MKICDSDIINHEPEVAKLVEQRDYIDPSDLGRDKQIEYEQLVEEARRREREERAGRPWNVVTEAGDAQ